jgi:WD40 repeat protein
MSQPDAPDIPGFGLLRRIGAGAYGEVWLVRDSFLGLFYALKIVWLVRPSDITPEEQAATRHRGERVRRGLETYLQARTRHGLRAIAVLELKLDPAGRFFYYTMPLADDARTGRAIEPGTFVLQEYEALTLKARFQQEADGYLPAGETVRLGERLAEALAELHSAGVVHQDVKPTNIIFLQGEPVFADIDLVRTTDATLTAAGTPGYVAPEESGQPPADVYSLGKTLFEAATGQLSRGHLTFPDDWDQRPDHEVLGELGEVCGRACERDPADRPSAERFRDELRLILAGKSPRKLYRLERWGRTARRGALIGVPVLLLVTSLAFYLWRTEQTKAFALHQSVLARAGAQIARGELGSARDTLQEPEAQRTGRGPEWRILWQQAQGDPATVCSISNQAIERLAFSPDGRRLAVQASDYELHVIRVEDGRTERVIQQFNTLGGWLDDHRVVGTRYLSDDDPTPLCVWNADSGQRSPDLAPGSHYVAGLVGAERQIAFRSSLRPGELGWLSADLKSPVRWQRWTDTLPSATDAAPGLIRVDDTGRRLIHLVRQGMGDHFRTAYFLDDLQDAQRATPEIELLEDPRDLAVSPDGLWVAKAESKTGTLTLRSGPRLEQRLTRLFPVIRTLAFSPDNRTLATGGDDQQVRLLNVTNLAVERVLRGHPVKLSSLAWSPDGQRLASGDGQGMIRISDLRRPHEAGQLLERLKAGGGGFQLVARSEPPALAVPDQRGTVTLVHPTTLERLQSIPACRSPVWLGASNLWSISTQSELVEVNLLTGDRRAFRLQGFTGDAVGVATPSGNRALIYGVEGVACTPLPPQGNVMAVRNPASEWNHGAVSGDGRLALTVGTNIAQYWDLACGEPRTRIKLPAKAYCAVFLPDHQRAWVGCDRHRLLLVDVASNTVVRTAVSEFELHFDLLLLPEAGRLVAASSDGHLGFLRLGDQRWIAEVEHPALAARTGAHQWRRLLRFPGSEDLYGMTDGGRLVRWVNPPRIDEPPTTGWRQRTEAWLGL